MYQACEKDGSVQFGSVEGISDEVGLSSRPRYVFLLVFFVFSRF
jgi:hypothetical protein